MVTWLPQALHAFKLRGDPYAMKGVNLTTLKWALLNTSCWGLYGVLTQDFWIGIGTVIIAPSTAFNIYLKVKADKKLALIEFDSITECSWDYFKTLPYELKEKLSNRVKYGHVKAKEETISKQDYDKLKRIDQWYWEAIYGIDMWDK